MIENLKKFIPYNVFIGDITCHDTHLVEIIEQWVPISGYNGKYQISTFGRVASFCRDKTGSIMNLRPNHKGYLRAELSVSTVLKKSIFVHKLVATHFIPNPENKPQVNHIDTNKLNNFFFNLEWMTNAENHKHKCDNNLNIIPQVAAYGPKLPAKQKRLNIVGVNNGNCRFTEKQIMEIFNSKNTQVQIASEYKTAQAYVSAIKSGKKWSHLTGKKYENINNSI